MWTVCEWTLYLYWSGMWTACGCALRDEHNVPIGTLVCECVLCVDANGCGVCVVLMSVWDTVMSMMCDGYTCSADLVYLSTNDVA